MNHSDHSPPTFWRSPAALALLVVVAVGGFYLYTEHQAHLFGMLPYALILACPLMHLFMHHGHGREAPRSPQGGRDEQHQ